MTGKCRLDPQTKLEKSNSNISGVSSSFLYWFHQDFFLNISPHTFLSIFFIILIVPFENIVTCYYMIGDFTKTLKGKLTFSKSPPQAPLGYENLREGLIKPPLDKGKLDPRREGFYFNPFPSTCTWSF